MVVILWQTDRYYPLMILPLFRCQVTSVMHPKCVSMDLYWAISIAQSVANQLDFSLIHSLNFPHGVMVQIQPRLLHPPATASSSFLGILRHSQAADSGSALEFPSRFDVPHPALAWADQEESFQHIRPSQFAEALLHGSLSTSDYHREPCRGTYLLPSVLTSLFFWSLPTTSEVRDMGWPANRELPLQTKLFHRHHKLTQWLYHSRHCLSLSIWCDPVLGILNGVLHVLSVSEFHPGSPHFHYFTDI